MEEEDIPEPLVTIVRESCRNCQGENSLIFISSWEFHERGKMVSLFLLLDIEQETSRTDGEGNGVMSGWGGRMDETQRDLLLSSNKEIFYYHPMSVR